MFTVTTLGNFGIAIAPFIALAGATAFGVTIALQGPLSNYGAGLVLILTRPFAVGDTITVDGVSGMVDEITLGATVLTGEDRERITIPSKDIVGQVIVNSDAYRVVETALYVSFGTDLDRAIAAVETALRSAPDVAQSPPPQAGVHDFIYGGVVIGLRFWVPSRRYFAARYAAHRGVLAAVRAAGVDFLEPVAIQRGTGDRPQPLGVE